MERTSVAEAGSDAEAGVDHGLGYRSSAEAAAEARALALSAESFSTSNDLADSNSERSSGAELTARPPSHPGRDSAPTTG